MPREVRVRRRLSQGGQGRRRRRGRGRGRGRAERVGNVRRGLRGTNLYSVCEQLLQGQSLKGVPRLRQRRGGQLGQRDDSNSSDSLCDHLWGEIRSFLW